MKTFVLSLATVALTLVATSATQANPKPGGHGPAKPGMSGNFKDYHLSHGTKFEHGYFYKGRNHEHWGEIRFDHRYNTRIYFDRGLDRWFYWCERDVCFYPVTYCPYRTYVCPPIEIRPLVVEPVRPVAIEPVRPIAAPIAVPVAPVAPSSAHVKVNVNVDASAR
jgi:hypothetical protein